MRKLALLVFFLHLAANPHYGFFRDELYFIICGRHPQFGYVDQPPLIPLLAAASQVFGISLVALRAVSAAFGAASVYVAILLVEELGGGAFAQALAAVAVALSPEIAVFGVLVGPDSATIVAWPLLALLVLRLTRGAPEKLWLAAGAVTGLALEAKYSAAFFVVALLLALIVTHEGRQVFSGWVLAGAAVALALALPSAVWQAVNGFPMMEVLAAGQRGKNVILGPGEYLLQQLFVTNPLLAPIWIAGFAWTFMKVRWLGLACGLTLVMVILLHGKDYYACGIFPVLFAAGAVAIEAWVHRLRPLVLGTALAGGLLTLPMIAPVLPEATFVRYETALHLRPRPSEHHQQSALPQHFADMHGWRELTATVAQVAATLTPEERARAVIKTPNYGEASAINFFGKAQGLPPAISGHNQYFLWGPQRDGDVLIDVDGDCGRKLDVFRSTTDAAVFTAPWVMPYEDRMPIRVCRGIKKPLSDLWPLVKNYN